MEKRYIITKEQSEEQLIEEITDILTDDDDNPYWSSDTLKGVKECLEESPVCDQPDRYILTELTIKIIEAGKDPSKEVVWKPVKGK